MISTANDTISVWAEKVLDIWGERMSVLGISNASQHAASLAHTVVSASGGSVARVEFFFEYILKFTDMGVGRGVSFASRRQSVTNRRQKQWFTKTFLLEVKKLSNILAKQHAYSGILYVKQELTEKQ